MQPMAHDHSELYNIYHVVVTISRVGHNSNITDVNIKSSTAFPRVGSSTCCVKKQSSTVSNKNLAIANRSRVSCINTNNNTMTLKSGFEVTQGH